MRQKKSIRHIDNKKGFGYIKFYHWLFPVILLYIFLAIIILAVAIRVAYSLV